MTEGAPSSDQEANLLDELLTIDFSPAEKDRIGRALVDSESAQARVLESSPQMIRDPEFWGRAQKNFRINGFRPGAPDATRKVVHRALAVARSHVTGGSDADWPTIWPLYRRAVRAHLEHERPGLARMLEQERLRAGDGSQTDQILRAIVRYLPLYEASVDHVRELYELWGFERTNFIEEIVSDVSLRADAVRRMIDDGVHALERELLKSIAGEREEQQRLLKAQARELASLRVELAELRGHLDVAREDRQSGNTPLRTTSSSPTSSHQAPQARVPATTAAPTSASESSQFATSSLELLNTRVESLGKQLKMLRHRIDERARDGPQLTRSLSDASTHSILTSSQVIERWHAALVAAGAPNSFAVAHVMLELVRKSRVLVTRAPQALTGLFTSLPDSQVLVIAASPLWLTDADWKDGLAFLKQAGDGPRLLVIENFDAGLQDAYLVPPLLAWLASVPATSASRVALVPTGDDLNEVSPRILEIATCIAHKAPHEGWPQFEERAMKSPQKEAQSAANLLTSEPSMSPSGERQLSKYFHNQKLFFPSRLIAGFVRVYEGLYSQLPAHEARVVAQDATLIPWAERARTAAQVMMLRTALDGLDVP